MSSWSMEGRALSSLGAETRQTTGEFMWSRIHLKITYPSERESGLHSSLASSSQRHPPSSSYSRAVGSGIDRCEAIKPIARRRNCARTESIVFSLLVCE